jgi:hypothetical protein
VCHHTLPEIILMCDRRNGSDFIFLKWLLSCPIIIEIIFVPAMYASDYILQHTLVGYVSGFSSSLHGSVCLLLSIHWYHTVLIIEI